jgi:hypothetical protein
MKLAVSSKRGYFFFNLWGGTLGTAATTGLLYQPRTIGDDDCGEIGGMNIGRGNRSTRRQFSATLSTTNPTWLDPVLNPGRRGGKPPTNLLSYGAAWLSNYWINSALNMSYYIAVTVANPKVCTSYSHKNIERFSCDRPIKLKTQKFFTSSPI